MCTASCVIAANVVPNGDDAVTTMRNDDRTDVSTTLLTNDVDDTHIVDESTVPPTEPVSVRPPALYSDPTSVTLVDPVPGMFVNACAIGDGPSIVIIFVVESPSRSNVTTAARFTTDECPLNDFECTDVDDCHDVDMPLEPPPRNSAVICDPTFELTNVTLVAPVDGVLPCVTETADAESIVTASDTVDHCRDDVTTPDSVAYCVAPTDVLLCMLVDDTHIVDMPGLPPSRAAMLVCSPVFAPTSVTLTAPVFALFT
jgi:hypothetical protein